MLGEQAARVAAGGAITGCDICGGVSEDVDMPCTIIILSFF